MDQARIAQKSPYLVDLEAGKAYYWCACGQSKNQPFCDGSHKGSQFTPPIRRLSVGAPLCADANKQKAGRCATEAIRRCNWRNVS